MGQFIKTVLLANFVIFNLISALAKKQCDLTEEGAVGSKFAAGEMKVNPHSLTRGSTELWYVQLGLSAPRYDLFFN